jgi:hypothetical protein
MSFLSGILSAQNQFQPIGTGTIGQQTQAANQNIQSGLQNQQAFIDALQAQNGIQNQSNVYNQLQNVASGQGPNPAQAMLAQATGQNTANQAALMAGQRGAGANVGLIARQAAQQGGANQQNAAGQAASLQAQQSLNALGQLGGLANTQVAQQQGALNSFNQAALGQQGNLGSQQSQINNINANVATQNTAQQNAITGGLLGAVGSIGQMALPGIGSAVGGLFSGGGGSPNPGTQAGFGVNTTNVNPAAGVNQWNMLADGGAVTEKTQPASGSSIEGPASIAGRFLKGTPAVMAQMAHGGKVPALVSPGERYLPPAEVKKVAEGKKSPMKAGEKIPGKPKVGGAKNSYANDTVPKTLESGGIVLPRSVTQHPQAPQKAKEFVQAIIAKQGPKKK